MSVVGIASSSNTDNADTRMCAQQLRAKETAELQSLQERIDALPAAGSAALEGLRHFRELPLSKKTLDGLTSAGWVEMTDIQRAAIVPGLQGRDVLGAARTGSGKTLAFVVPVRARASYPHSMPLC